MRVKEELLRLDISPRKSRGQNFLLSPDIARNIVEFSRVLPQEPILEIGPGLGMLTEELRRRTNRLLLVELESKFALYLKSKFDLPDDQIIAQDIRLVSAETIAERLATDKFSVVSNTPYSISSEIVLWVITERKWIRSATLLLQTEFAERVSAEPGSKAYGSLSVLVQLFTEPSIGLSVPGNSFHPPTEVESSALLLSVRDKPRAEVLDTKHFERLVRGSFSKRRKTLLNSLSSQEGFSDKKELERLLRSLEIDPGRRAETLSVEEYARLSNATLESATFSRTRPSDEHEKT